MLLTQLYAPSHVFKTHLKRDILSLQNGILYSLDPAVLGKLRGVIT